MSIRAIRTAAQAVSHLRAPRFGGALLRTTTPLLSAKKDSADKVKHAESLATPSFAPASECGDRKKIFQDVLRQILDGGVFTFAYAESETKSYIMDIGLNDLYFRSFDVATIASHVTAFMAAKRVAMMSSGDPEAGLQRLEYQSMQPGLGGALFITADNDTLVHETEKTLSQYLLDHRTATHGYALKAFRSRNPLTEGSGVHIVIYIVQWSEWAQPPPIRNPRGNLLASTPELLKLPRDHAGRVGAREYRDYELSHPDFAPKPFVPKEMAQVATCNFMETKAEDMVARYFEAVAHTHKHVSPFAKVARTTDPDTGEPWTSVTLAVYREKSSSLRELSEVFRKYGLRPTRRFVETFSNDIEVYTNYFNIPYEQFPSRLKLDLSLLAVVPSAYESAGQGVIREKYFAGELSPEEFVYSYSALIFSYYFAKSALATDDYRVLSQQLSSNKAAQRHLDALMDQTSLPALTEVRIVSALVSHISMLKRCFKDFNERIGAAESSPPSAELLSAVEREIGSHIDNAVFKSLIVFNASIVKTNFTKADKGAVSFRLDPKVIADNLGFPFREVPFAMFLVTGAHFRGFHIRFAPIARGGIRMIPAAQPGQHEVNKQRLLDENLSLAFTQQQKNAVIPEGGSKGVILCSPSYFGPPRKVFERYTNAILDTIIPNDEVVDRLKKEEVIFFGPDENTADYMALGCDIAKARGYTFASSFTTGKPPSMGGIPHDVYGMTTRSVRAFVEGIQSRLNLDPSKCTKVQIGGPDGDLGSNEILLGKERTKAVVDISGVLFDEDGLDDAELKRLAHSRLRAFNFDTSKLSPKGFFISTNDDDVTLPGGRQIPNGLRFRNTFHLDPMAKADFFVPCGGRPRSVDASTVGKLLPNETLREPLYTHIVEGANLFFTEDARETLERGGVSFFKDATANKGGVTSSSLEVLAGLALTPEQHTEWMKVKGSERPAFYKSYVEDVQAVIRGNAEMEFNLLWDEYIRQNGRRTRTEMSGFYSRRINLLFDALIGTSLTDYKDPNGIGRIVLRSYLPKTLLDHVSIDQVVERVPHDYLKAIIATRIAAQYTFQYGQYANEIMFYNYLTKFAEEGKPPTPPDFSAAQ